MAPRRSNKKNHLEFNRASFKVMRNLPAAQRELVKLAYEMKANLGEDYKVTELHLEENRAAVSILATGKATIQNRRNHTLLKELIRRAQ